MSTDDDSFSQSENSKEPTPPATDAQPTVDPTAITTAAELGAALTQLRIAAGLTVRALANSSAPLGSLSGWFSGRHVPEARSMPTFADVLAALDVPEAEIPAWQEAAARARRGPLRSATDPYRGFASFRESDADIFFGRDQETARLVALVAAAARRPSGHRIVVVVGASGAGKSSVARAGLLAAVHDAAVHNATDSDDLTGFAAVVGTPGSDPQSVLDTALASLPTDRDRIVVIDQLEELWTQAGEAERDEAAAALLRLTAVDSAAVTVAVLVVRADFYGALSQLPGYSTTLQDSQVVVGPMDESQLHDVIVGPAQKAGFAVAPALVKLLIEDAGAARGSGRGQSSESALPLLSHALLTSWRASDRRALSVSDYISTGRIDGAVERSAEASYASLSASQRDTLRSMMLTMVNVEDEVVTRRRVPLTELAPLGSGDDAVVALERFVSARLVTIGEDDAQLTHEALLHAWPRLRGWVADNRANLILRNRLRASTRLWDDSGRGEDHLLSRGGVELYEGLQQQNQSPVVLSAAETEFLDASRAWHEERADRDRKQRRLLTTVAVGAVVLMVLAIASAAYGLISSNQAQKSRTAAIHAADQSLSRQLAFQSLGLRSTDSALARQIALVAYRTAPTVEARSALIESTVTAAPARYATAPGPTRFQVDAKHGVIYVANADDRIRVFAYDGDRITRQVTTFGLGRPQGNLYALAYDPSRDTLYTSGVFGIDRWNVRDPGAPKLISSTATENAVLDLGIRADGTQLAAVITGAGTELYRVDTATLTKLPSPVTGTDGRAVGYSPDGKFLVTSTNPLLTTVWAVDGERLTKVGDIELPDAASNEQALQVQFAGNSTVFLSLRSRKVIRVDISDPTHPRITGSYGGFSSYTNFSAVSPDGQSLAVASSDNTVKVFDLAHPELKPISLACSAVIGQVGYLGNHVIATGEDGLIREWPANLGSPTASVRAIFQIATTPDGSVGLVNGADQYNAVSQWTIGDATQTRRGPTVFAPKGITYSSAIGLSESGQHAVFGSADGGVYFADYSNPAAPHLIGNVLQPFQTLVQGVSITDRGVAAATGTATKEVALFDISDIAHPKAAARIDAEDEAFWAEISPDGTRLAITTLTGWVREYIITDPYHPVQRFAKKLFNGVGLMVRYSPDSNRIVASGDTKSVALLDISDPKRIVELSRTPSLSSDPYGIGFSRDGSLVAATTGSGETWVWRADDGGTRLTLWAQLRGSNQRNWYLNFSPHDSSLIVVGEAGILETLNLDPDQIARSTCALGGISITESEWQTYVPGHPYDPPCRG